MQLNETFSTSSILVIGAGRMGSAIIKGWVDSGVPASNIYVIDNNSALTDNLVQTLSINGYHDIDQIDLETKFSIIMVALKPQVIARVLPLYRDFFESNALLLSIAAGVTNDQLTQLIPDDTSVIRVMPNTPLLVNKGVIAAASCDSSSDLQKTYCEALFSPLGAFHWLQNESQMHAVTAISGSGPAYTFYFAQMFSQAASQLGLTPQLAEQLAIDTMIGASYLMESDPRDVSQLRQEVTSPNGTTAAAIEVLSRQDELLNLLKGTLIAASDRSIALAQQK